MDTEDVVHTHTRNEILCDHEKEWNFTIYDTMSGLREYYAN